MLRTVQPNEEIQARPHTGRAAAGLNMEAPPQPEEPLPLDNTHPDFFNYLNAENGADPFPGLQLLRTGALRRTFQLLGGSLRELGLIRCNDFLWQQTVLSMLPTLSNLESLVITVSLDFGCREGMRSGLVICRH
ncbi:hypothetical protein WJX72_006925 [[Myrmecia] bisecta]|uniref:Uncharacterized protein n=1 Tax=[Myrmecia] bisecta TaxID=41462 RepID=A0AAW1PGH7_9CHLO